jgi:TonB family protein
MNEHVGQASSASLRTLDLHVLDKADLTDSGFGEGTFRKVLLDEGRPGRSAGSWILSFVGHGLAVGALLAIPAALPEASSQVGRQLASLVAPPVERPPATEQRIVRPVQIPRTKAFVAPVAPRVSAAKPVTPDFPLEAPVVSVAILQPSPNVPNIPRELPPPIRTDNLPQATAAPVPAKRIAVQPSGFSGAESATPNTTRGVVTGVGSFNAVSAAQAAPRATAIATGSFGAARTSEDRTPARGSVAPTSAFTPAPAPEEPVRREAVSKGVFGDTTIAAATRNVAAPAAPVAETPVEIVSKPRPEYTSEARNLHIEGEVLLEILFSASGEARVTRVVRGLGHGLDETAAAAARGIRFKPARRGGVPTDSSAVVHITFQLALGDVK